jgi:TRAP-type uncharacterized transport system fused permease subunit
MRVGYQAMRLAIVAYLVPFVSIFQPALLLQGTLVEIGIAAATATLAVYALSVGFEGFCLVSLNWIERIIWLAGGFLLFVPSIPLAGPGLFLFAFGFSVQWLKRKRRRITQGSIID